MMKKAFMWLVLGSLAWAQEPDQPPMVELPSIPSGGGLTRGQPMRGVDIRGNGDGSAHHFFYVVKSKPGTLVLHLQARAREGATAVKVRLQDEQGTDLSKVEALAGSEDEVLELGRFQVEQPRTLHLHMNIDPNTGPYNLTVTGPLER